MLSNIVYLTSVLTFAVGLYIVQTSRNYFRRMIGLSLFQTGVLIFYVALAKIHNGIPPILFSMNSLDKNKIILSNPLPHVLMLTAIVVSLATLSVGLALVWQISNNFKSQEITELEKYILSEDVNSTEAIINCH